MYYLDPAIFGQPQYGLGATPGQRFTRKSGDGGSGEYVPYNPSAPVAVTATYQWSGAKLAAFRSDWETASKLNFGGGWFEADLPLYLSGGGRVQRYRVHFIAPFSVNLISHDRWEVSMQWDVDMSPALVPS